MATSWTDATLTANASSVRKVHLSEMRASLNTERSRRGLATVSFTDSTTEANSTNAKTTHVNELRTGISAFSPATWTDGTLVSNGTSLKKAHVDELRAKIVALESHAKVGGVSDCNSSCSGLCVGCTGTCTGGCTGCSGSCTGSCSGCSGDSCTSCFPAGTKVLLGDLTEKKIEDVAVGDEVMGLDSQKHKVVGLYPTKLGRDRALFQFTDKSLAWSGEHPLWIRNEAGEEYWGVHDYNAYIREIYGPQPNVPPEYQNYGLKKKEPLVITTPVEYAHVSGWRKQIACIDRAAGSDTPLYDLIIDGPGTMICNGYVVSAFASDNRYDFCQFRWEGLQCRHS
jgi:Hom_end-associated Hint.